MATFRTDRDGRYDSDPPPGRHQPPDIRATPTLPAFAVGLCPVPAPVPARLRKRALIGGLSGSPDDATQGACSAVTIYPVASYISFT